MAPLAMSFSYGVTMSGVSRAPEATRLDVLDQVVSVHYQSAEPRQLRQPKLAALAVRLALANAMRVSQAELDKELWDGTGSDALPRAISDLRNDFGLPIPKRERRPTYQLNLDRGQVDA